MPLTESELEPTLRLALVQGIGPTRLAQVMERFGSAEAVLGSGVDELRAVPGIGVELAARVREARGSAAKESTRAHLKRLREMGAVVLGPDDPHFPDAFRSVSDPPYLLFAVGDIGLLREQSIAIVGTRTPTAYGRDAARRLGRDLSLGGYAIVSGMARGIDTSAHLGALDGSGRTVGVLGNGIEQVYPPENRKLFASVREEGLLITEYPPGETPKAGNFPRRNRLITALAEAVIVVEMSHRSGAQHTVAFALEQGKEVMAVPGPIDSAASEGTNQLIKDGARLVTCAADAIEELRGVGEARGYGTAVTDVNRLPARPADPTATLSLLTAEEERMLAALSSFPAHIDELARAAELSTSSALVTLLDLELRGLVLASPGKLYSRAGRAGG